MFIKEAWFWRGFQSAIFYYISCAPCTKILDQRSKKQKAKRAKAEKAALKLQQAQEGAEERYDHPLPSSTNPFWEEEMKLGPGPPPKRRNRQGHEGERGGKKNGSVEMQQKGKSLELKSGEGASSSDTSKGTSSDSSGPEVLQEATSHESDEGWNRRRYQREDELLWGLEGDYDPAVGGAPLSRTQSGGRGQGSYYYARNPAVNDLHPPVVSTAPKSKTETQWMLQPPPRAKIMEGKEKENRSRSGTGSTHSSRTSSKRAVEVGLRRQLSNRAMDLKTKRGSGGDQLQAATLLGVGGIGLSRSRGSSTQSIPSKPLSRTPSGQRHDRDTATAVAATPRSQPSSNSLQPSRSSSQRKAAPPPNSLDSEPPPPSTPPARPGLQTILSTSLVHASKNEKEARKLGLPSLGSVNGTSSQSLNVLQEPTPPSSTINRSSSLNTHERDAISAELPSISAHKDEDLRFPERISSWFPGAEDGWAIAGEDGNLRGNVRPGHRHRWSMDI